MTAEREENQRNLRWWGQDASVIWNVRSMAAFLVDRRVTPSHRIGFLIWFILIANGVFLLVPRLKPPDRTCLESVLLTISSCLIIIAGVYLTNRANAKGDDKDFMERFVCLGGWIAIRLMLLGWIPGHIVVDNNKHMWKFASVHLDLLLQIIFFCWLYHCIGVVSQLAENKESIGQG